MIHPQYWSLYTIYRRIWYNNDSATYAKYLNVKGRTVLDVGAANFDTARIFLKYGAERVICIERDFYPIPNDLKKCVRDGIILPIVQSFNPDQHLSLRFDVAKFDIEGYELELLPYLQELPRTIIEVHSEYAVDKFIERGWRLLKRNDVAAERCIQALMVNDK